jgi:sterol desaturase/sphingolipid hydroxylase (fatty acid hydroxylase superfamily)
MANWVLGGLFVLYLGLLAQDRWAPARAMPRIGGGWRAWGVFFWVLTVVVNGALPYVLRPVFAKHHLLDLARAPEVPAALLGFAAYDLLVYWLHRLWHRVPFLWRWVHQMHHAPERMDPAGMCFFHPIEIVGLAIASTTFYGFVLGFSPEAGALAGTVFVAFGMFQHSNLSTPRWLGWLVQRPEQHGVHHQRGLHGRNYSDLPLWDWLFGTFENPASWNEQAGLEDGALKQWRSLLAGRDYSSSAPMSGD